MQSVINQMQSILKLQEDPEASTNGQVLEALLDFSGTFPNVIIKLQALQCEAQLATTRACGQAPAHQDTLGLIADLSAALDNALLHHGHAMPAADAVRRRQLVDRAEGFAAQ